MIYNKNIYNFAVIASAIIIIGGLEAQTAFPKDQAKQAHEVQIQ